jgi:hypothetical protein
MKTIRKKGFEAEIAEGCDIIGEATVNLKELKHDQGAGVAIELEGVVSLQMIAAGMCSLLINMADDAGVAHDQVLENLLKTFAEVSESSKMEI